MEFGRFPCTQFGNLSKEETSSKIVMEDGKKNMRCYNKGCGVEFKEGENGSEACVHHPGQPVFHDAYKGWSCCKKRTTDFTEFLNIPGCLKSPHNPEKPLPEELKTVEDNEEKEKVIVVEAPREPNPTQKEERPSEEEEMVLLETTIGSSLRTALSKLDISKPAEENSENNQSTINVGTACKNTCCNSTYQGDQSNRETCTYHPGSAIFHEGMKYWSCCQIKTSDFDNFMAQPGCKTGNHRWVETESERAQKVACRYDWHQTGSFAVLSVYCKNTLPDRTTIKANAVRLSIDICFDNGRNRFQKIITLEGVTDPQRSSVQLLGTKAEIKLRKAEPLSWKKFEL